VLLGAYDGGEPATLEGIDRLEQRIGVTLPLIQLYTAWGDTPDEQFPGRVAAAIRDFGSVPLISWEPWLTDFESALHPNIALRDVRENHGMAAVARGEYDFYIDAWAVDAARFGHPIFVRLGHEMNDPYRYPWGPQHNTKEEFIAAGAWFFFVVNLLKLPIYWIMPHFGTHKLLISSDTLLIDACLLPAVVIGSLVGRRLVPHIPQRAFELVVLLLAAAASLSMLRPLLP
jgi:hypothetical protein